MSEKKDKVEVRDLMIGNVINSPYGPCTINEIRPKTAEVEGICVVKGDIALGDKYILAFSYERLSPIPLSASVLEACGFVKDDGLGTYLDRYTFGHFKLLDNDGVFIWKLPELPEVEVRTLHHLQNLFSAVTGHSLPIAVDKIK